MEEKQKCPICGMEFIPSKKKWQIYCCRKCFKKAYRRRQKRIKQPVSKFPYFSCSFCGSKTELTFHPKKSPLKWKQYKCTICGHSK